jgi:phage recombination protein Bet
MSTTLAMATQSNMPSISDLEVMQVLQNSLYPGAQPESIKMVLGYCKAAGLDVMQKPVHIVPMYAATGKKDGKGFDIKAMRDVIMPGIGLYRTQAVRSGHYAGVSEPEFGPDVNTEIGGVKITYPKWCKVTVRRSMDNGNIAEFSATEFWLENYATKGRDSDAPNAMWSKRPYGQIAKCAESQALRKGFPEVGSSPTAEEMEGKETEHFIEGETARSAKPAATEPPRELPQYSTENFKKFFPAWKDYVQSGKKTAMEIIKLAGSKGTLSPAQKQAILDIEIPVKAAESMTVEQVAEYLKRSVTLDELNEAADLIRHVEESKQQELTDIYNTLLQKFGD